MDISRIVNFGFYFSHTDLVYFHSSKFFIGFSVLMVLVGIIFMVYRKYILEDNYKKRLTKKFAKRIILFGVLALFLVWVRIENIRILSLRIWWVIYFLLFFITIYISYKTYKKGISLKRINTKTKEDPKEKYLPKQKKKKSKKRR